MKRFFVGLVALVLLFSACQNRESGRSLRSVAVFVPGVSSGSPIYEMLVAGARKAVAEFPDAKIKVIEGGYDQATWLDKIRDIAASGEFDLVVTSNPALPELCAKVAADYPELRFFVADAYMKDNASIYTVLYNQMEQGYLVGYLAGLATASASPKGPLVAGLVVAQRYPTLDKLIQPGFEAGLKAVDPSFSLELREIGNWYDANKAAELARSIYESGARVILPIAGGAGQGVVAVATELGRSVVWFDGAGYQLAPGTVIGCATLAQDRLVYEKVKAILQGKKPFGTAEIVGASEGYVGFDLSGAAYIALPQQVKNEFEEVIAQLIKGKPDFTLTSF